MRQRAKLLKKPVIVAAALPQPPPRQIIGKGRYQAQVCLNKSLSSVALAYRLYDTQRIDGVFYLRLPLYPGQLTPGTDDRHQHPVPLSYCPNQSR